jgi:hypothetical protein
VPSVGTTVAFGDVCFEVTTAPESVTIRTDADNWVTISRKSQQTTSEASIAGGLVLIDERHGRVDYARHFVLAWDEEDALPELRFQHPPSQVIRSYPRGQC